MVSKRELERRLAEKHVTIQDLSARLERSIASLKETEAIISEFLKYTGMEEHYVTAWIGGVADPYATDYRQLLEDLTIVNGIDRVLAKLKKDSDEDEYEELSRRAEAGELKVKPETVLRGEEAAMKARQYLKEAPDYEEKNND